MNAVPERWKNKKPRAVSQQVEEARALFATTVEGAGQGEVPEQEARAPDPAAVEAEQAERVQDAAAEPEQVERVQGAAVEAELVERAQGAQEARGNTVDWEHKYKSLKGKHDADFARLNRIIDEQAQQLEHLHRMLADTRTGGEPALWTEPARESGSGPASLPPAEDFTAEELDEFGPDMAKFVAKAARRELAGALNDILRRLDKVEREAAGARAHSQRVLTESFYDALDRLVPQWRQLNTDRDFLAWLNGVDTFTGQTRISLLRQAEENKDAQRASAFFKAWLDETGRSGGEQPASPAQSGRRDIRSLVAPGKAAPSTGTAPRRTIAATPPEKQPELITGADVKAFFERRRTMSPEAFEAGRRIIAQALKEGRVVD